MRDAKTSSNIPQKGSGNKKSKGANSDWINVLPKHKKDINHKSSDGSDNEIKIPKKKQKCKPFVSSKINDTQNYCSESKEKHPVRKKNPKSNESDSSLDEVFKDVNAKKALKNTQNKKLDEKIS